MDCQCPLLFLFIYELDFRYGWNAVALFIFFSVILFFSQTVLSDPFSFYSVRQEEIALDS